MSDETGAVVIVAPRESPAPRRDRSAGHSTEAMLTEVLAQVVGSQHISADSHFFDDLGADSLMMAHFCARVRKHPDLPSVSMKDIYRHSTIGTLAASLPDVQPAPAEPSALERTEPQPVEVAPLSSNRQYVVCGALQLLIFFGYTYLTAMVVGRAYDWISAAPDEVHIYARSVVAGAGLFVFLFTFPVLAKWLLIGRWKPQEIPVWSLAYVRFWLVRTLVQRNLLVFLFVGSPLYPLYLRALGAKVGRGVTIFSLNVPVCTDLLSIGDNTVIRKDSFLNCYRAHSGLIQTGAVTLGSDVYVGELTVIDIGSSMGDGAQLGHSSSLHAGQSVPAGEHWHGSPGQPTDVDYRTVDARACGTWRRGAYAMLQLVYVLGLFLPLAIGGVTLLLVEVPVLSAVLDPDTAALTSWTFYAHALDASAVLFFGSLVCGLAIVTTVPRLLNLALTPDQVYPLYGLHYSLHRTIARMTNLRVFTFLFGDSSYIVSYLRWIGYDLSHVHQTGSNFGLAVKHESPFLSTVGSGTMVADRLSIMNADFSSTSFKVSQTTIGAHNFLGNNIAYPPQGRTGENCLLATKVMVPMDGEIRENVGLLGSPSFEIPRTVDRDTSFDLEGAEELHRRLSAKNKHNLVTMGIYLLVRWAFVFVVTVVASAAAGLYSTIGAPVIALANILLLAFGVGYFVLVERAVRRLHAVRPTGCSIYEVGFWRHERFWKVPATAYLLAFNGTPFKNLILRSLGVRVGRRVFDDGCGLTERPMVTIGDDCTLNAASMIQCHSQEDGAFKSDHVVIGDGCTLGVGAFVHYGVTMGDAAVLAADAFLMKGEDVPPRAHWGGNPAREMPDDTVHLRLTRDGVDHTTAPVSRR